MSSMSKVLGLLPALGLILFAVLLSSSETGARDTFVKDLFSRRSSPTHPQGSELLGDSECERIVLGGGENVLERNRVFMPSPKVLLKDSYPQSANPDEIYCDFALHAPWFPGTGSLGRIQRDLVKVAALKPGWSAMRPEGIRIVDSGETLFSTGRLIGDPRTLFSSFEIQVDRANFDVKFFGMKNHQERSLLFECKAGLGSSEYPTPRGSFYIMRIYDDNPLWIPPQDRAWAWGQTSSRSAYGGHMLPFFHKQPMNASGRADDLDDGLDRVASPVKMVDAGTYRIHGTDSPWSVGSSQSHGCVRLLNSSVARLADTLKLYVGITTRGESPNGRYVNLARPVRLILY